jgi:hypothetical protein
MIWLRRDQRKNCIGNHLPNPFSNPQQLGSPVAVVGVCYRRRFCLSLLPSSPRCCRLCPRMPACQRAVIPVAWWRQLEQPRTLPHAPTPRRDRDQRQPCSHWNISTLRRKLWWLAAEWVKRGNRSLLVLPEKYPPQHIFAKVQRATSRVRSLI